MGEPDGRHHLQIAEIFTSLQGEGRLQGELATFVRTAGCGLRCRWCDTAYARTGGTPMTVGEVVASVTEANVSRVCVTGGEPLDQPEAPALFSELKTHGFFVSVETNGTRDIGAFSDVDSFSVDHKLPSAGVEEPFFPGNWASLRREDELKFVVADRTDYEAAKRTIAESPTAATLIMSPCFKKKAHPEQRGAGALDLLFPQKLAEWIIADRLPVRLSLQLHKLLGVR